MKFRGILSLDGGGVRGILSIAFLERMEEVCRQQDASGTPTRIADHFDLVGGTSTGAITGTTMALGYPAARLRDFYFSLAKDVFRRSRWRLSGLQSRFNAVRLEQVIENEMGDRRLDSADLLTHLAIVTKRMDTGSPWIVHTCREGRFWNDPPDGSYIGNRNFRLASLLRASSAAPYFFAPARIRIAAGMPHGLFVDGAVSPYNNPALALLMLATIPAHGFSWPRGADRLRIVSVGTGTFRTRLDAASVRWMPALGLAVRALASVIEDEGQLVLALMQVLGRSLTPWVINSEIGDLRDALLPDAPLFTFVRYDVRLEEQWLREELDIRLSAVELRQLRQIDHAGGIKLLHDIGRVAAARQVRADHLAGG